MAFLPFRRSNTAQQVLKSAPRLPRRPPKRLEDDPGWPQHSPRGASEGLRKPRTAPRRLSEGPTRGNKKSN
eukprot:3626142-Pyramimonas_sp.AAC.1